MKLPKLLSRFKAKGQCYVLLQGDWIHPDAPFLMANCLWYPERSMSLFDRVNYRPYVQSIVTETPWLIGLYDRQSVFIVDESGEWRGPDYQTYGSSVEYLYRGVLEIPSSVSAQVLDGGRQLEKVIAEYASRIKTANKLVTSI